MQTRLAGNKRALRREAAWPMKIERCLRPPPAANDDARHRVGADGQYELFNHLPDRCAVYGRDVWDRELVDARAEADKRETTTSRARSTASPSLTLGADVWRPDDIYPTFKKFKADDVDRGKCATGPGNYVRAGVLAIGRQAVAS
jgi:hypothetical protein